MKPLAIGAVLALLLTAALSNAFAAGGGAACGPNGLVCGKGQVCCSTDPLPPAGPRFYCASQKQGCVNR